MCGARSAPHFFIADQTMTIGIAGPGRKAPRQNAMVRVIIAAFVGGISLILLGLASDFLVDWLWFSSIGYLPVFLTSLGAKALVFFAVLTATAVILWLNGLLAARFARRQSLRTAAAPWNPAGITPSSDPFAHRMMAVATKTAEKTSALALMVVQKTCT